MFVLCTQPTQQKLSSSLPLPHQSIPLHILQNLDDLADLHRIKQTDNAHIVDRSEGILRHQHALVDGSVDRQVLDDRTDEAHLLGVKIMLL